MKSPTHFIRLVLPILVLGTPFFSGCQSVYYDTMQKFGVHKRDLLVERVEEGDFRELILATNPTLEGESTSLYIQRRLAREGLRITRLARGLPVGGDLEYTDEITLGRAMEGRQEL